MCLRVLPDLAHLNSLAAHLPKSTHALASQQSRMGSDFAALFDDILANAAPASGLVDGRAHSVAIRDLCAQAGTALEHLKWDQAAAHIAGLSAHQLGDILRFSTTRFHLLNQLEQVQISRINHERALAATPEKPRAESLMEAMVRLKELGLDARGVQSLIARIDVQPTLTAHPTEAKRRSVLDNLVKIAGILQQIANDKTTPSDHRDAQRRIDALVRVLLATDDVRPKRLEVHDEVKNGMFFLRSSIWQTVPRLMHQLRDAAQSVFGANALDITELPPLIRYRTWIGGDRDGNPRVTHEVTAHTLAFMRKSAIELWDKELLDLKQELTLSRRCVNIPDWFVKHVEDVGIENILETTSLEQRQHEPIRIMLMQIQGRMHKDPTYDGASLLQDLLLIRDALYEMGLHDIAQGGKLADSIVRARAFGLHLATVDVRQHSRVHEVAVSELLAMAGVCPNYARLSETEKQAVLHRELAQPRPLRFHDAPLSDASAELMRTFEVIKQANAVDRRSVRSYVISMTHGLSDVLEVLLLMKESGLAKVSHDTSGSPRFTGTVHVVPLLETIDDLERGESLVASMLDDPFYKTFVESLIPAGLAPEMRRPMQEIMLGYSDSNKDGGFFMANLALDKAQRVIAKTVTSRGLFLRFFYGRGGTIGRGGGRAGRAILSTPAPARTGRLRFTEQGEVISFRYALASIAERHLEQIVHASLLASADQSDPQPPEELAPLLDRLSKRSMQAYRQLIDDPEFWSWFSTSGPIAPIGGFPIASRPVMRAVGSGIGDTQSAFDQLRAIPWVFTWVQMRCLAPGWFGLGTALAQSSPQELDLLAGEYRRNAWLSTVIDNAAQELVRARMAITRRYSIATQSPAGQRFYSMLVSEYDLAVKGVLGISGKKALGEESPVITRSIHERNPWTDVLNLVQVELLVRRRNAVDADKPMLDQLLLQSVSAIAAAMQSTG